MLRYTQVRITFEEVPTEVCLSLSISGCQNRCQGCHSPELRLDEGVEITDVVMQDLLTHNEGVSCVLFLGEGRDPERLKELARLVNNAGLKVALYSGRNAVEEDIWQVFDYIKIGEYDSRFGALNVPTTNQRLYQKVKPQQYATKLGVIWNDITARLWR